MQEKRQYIDTRTGEVVREGVTDFSHPLTDEGYRFPSHKMGARMFAGIDFPEGMSDAEIGQMTKLARNYMVSQSNMLGYRESKRIKAYTAPEISELAGYGERHGRRFIARMVKLRVLQKVVTSSGPQWYVNPIYFMANGQRLTLDLFLLFRNDLSAILPQWVMFEFLRQARDKAVLKNDAVSEAGEILESCGEPS